MVADTHTHTQIEKKVEAIKNGCQVTTKKLGNTIQGSGSSMDKHQASGVVVALHLTNVHTCSASSPSTALAWA